MHFICTHNLTICTHRVVNLNKYLLFHDGGLYHLETCPLICYKNHWTGLYLTGTSVMKEFKKILIINPILTNENERIPLFGLVNTKL